MSGDLKKVLEQAKEAAREKNVWIEGGASVAQQFINEGLVDEIVLTLVPKILGSGIRLFDNIQKLHRFSLTDVRRFEKGLVQLTYEANNA